jgi:hypothetical protein
MIASTLATPAQSSASAGLGLWEVTVQYTARLHIMGTIGRAAEEPVGLSNASAPVLEADR